MSAREEILRALRDTLGRTDLRFPPPVTASLDDAERMTVTAAEGGAQALAARFGAELQALQGSFEIVGSPTEARLALVGRLQGWMAAAAEERRGAVPVTGTERSILAWNPELLPVSGLAETLNDLGMTLAAPAELFTQEERERVRSIRYGLTGVEAAFAATGSLLVVARPGMSRAASLLPPRHIALVPFSRLYPTIEDWLRLRRGAGELVDLLRTNANLTLITGPSKSADIEMNLTLGVHGPKFVHAILFDDRTHDNE